MVFSSVPFLFYFLPSLLALYVAIPRARRAWRNGLLLAASLLFYAWGEGVYVLLMLISITANHYIAKSIGGCTGRSKAARLALGVAFNLAMLGWFKYAGFIANLIGIDGGPDPHLPIGISFFTFQATSYLIDVYRRDAQPAEELRESALYIASFPQLIAGPIVRYKEIAEQLRERTETAAKFIDGARTFTLGLAQKVLIADIAAGPADQIFSLSPADLSPLAAWAGAIAYSVQIFFDFAGYSNMAIGLGLMFGFTFPRNFNYPYIAQSVTEFWRRWHMTLSSWFRDYLYIPLGGNRSGRTRTIINLWIVFVLCGLWHGAAWTFIAWGAYHGALLTAERLGLGGLLKRTWRPLRHGYLVLAIILGWVVFRAPDLAHALAYYGRMFNVYDWLSGEGLPAAQFVSGNLPVFLAASAIFATPLAERLAQKAAARLGEHEFAVRWLGLFALLFLAITFVAGGAYSPFIYFQF